MHPPGLLLALVQPGLSRLHLPLPAVSLTLPPLLLGLQLALQLLDPGQLLLLFLKVALVLLLQKEASSRRLKAELLSPVQQSTPLHFQVAVLLGQNFLEAEKQLGQRLYPLEEL